MTRTLLLVVTAALALAAPAAAKDGVEALVTTRLPADAEPGAKLRVAWTLTYEHRGARRPFNAVGVFVRLGSRGSGPATTGFATATAHTDGRYDADVVVPKGGIGAVEIGLRGTTDVLFPLRNDPLAPAEREDEPPSAWLVAPLVLLALGLMAVLRSQPTSPPRTTIRRAPRV